MTRLAKKLELIYKLRGEDVQSAMDELKSIVTNDAQNIAAYKERKLRELLDFVSRECEFYCDIASHSTTAFENGSTFEVLRDLPAVDKWTIKNNLDRFMSPGMKISWRSTSGTTGTPFVFPKDKHASAYMDAMMYSAYAWQGIEPLARQARIWGSAIGIKGKLTQKGKDWLLGRKRLSAFEISDVNCKRYFQQLLRHKPRYFYCYPNAMYQFVLSLEKQGLDGREIKASEVICTGEILFAHQKEKIERFMGCKVINEYGTTENGIIAFECEYGMMHVLPTIYIQILNPDINGFGEIAVTELNSRSMPFIKYKSGDVGKISDVTCFCKRSFETIDVKKGRNNDIIVCPEGTYVYAAILPYIFKNYTIKFKAYQERINLIDIYIVPKNEWDLTIEYKCKLELKKYLGDQMHINIKKVGQIPFDKNGKFKYFISKLNTMQ